MKKIVTFLFAFAMSLPLWCGETGLFTYEGGFFIKMEIFGKNIAPKINLEYGIHIVNMEKKPTIIISEIIP